MKAYVITMYDNGLDPLKDEAITAIASAHGGEWVHSGQILFSPFTRDSEFMVAERDAGKLAAAFEAAGFTTVTETDVESGK